MAVKWGAPPSRVDASVSAEQRLQDGLAMASALTPERKHRAKQLAPSKIAAGDYVYVPNREAHPAKLSERFEGPYLVTQVDGETVEFQKGRRKKSCSAHLSQVQLAANPDREAEETGTARK